MSTQISLRLFVAVFLICDPSSSFSALSTPGSSAQSSPELHPDSQTQSATVPLYIENNRPFIDIEFDRPDGSTRKARFWVDTGGGGFIMVEPLARDLGLKLGSVVSEGGSKFASTEPPVARIGTMPLDLEKANTIAAIGQPSMMAGVPAEGLLPGHVLMRYHVVFDYPGRKFVISKPRTVKPRGSQLASPVHERSGFPRIEAKIGEQNYGFLLDTGASFTMISQEVLNKWSSEHPGWPRARGAVGAANMGLGSTEVNGVMMRLPRVELARFQLNGVAVVSRPNGTFENYMSRMMSAPIVGAIGGNILKQFRVEIDYANGVTYLEDAVKPDVNDLDVIGLTLQAKWDGTYVIAGIFENVNEEIKQAVRGGDRLVRVDSLEVTGAAFGRVIDALRGKPGQSRSLLLEREGKRFEVKGLVIRAL